MTNILIKIYAHIFIRYVKLFSRRRMKKYMYEAIDNFAKDKKTIFNIGSGGIIARYLKDKNIKFKEIDIDPERKPDIVMSMEDMSKVKDNSVDVIFCMEVLEHVQNPHIAIAEAKRVLKKGGIFVGSTPFVFPMHDLPHDYYRYTKFGLKHLFKEFKEHYIKERNSYMASVYVVLIRPLAVGTILQRLVTLLIFPIFILLLPVFLFLSLVVRNTEATTGYFFVFEKQ